MNKSAGQRPSVKQNPRPVNVWSGRREPCPGCPNDFSVWIAAMNPFSSPVATGCKNRFCFAAGAFAHMPINDAQCRLPVNHKEPSSLAFEPFPTLAFYNKGLVREHPVLKQALLAFGTDPHRKCFQFSVFEVFWPFFTRTVVDVKITLLEETKSTTARFFT